ncbi:MAG: DUF2497 domain-containing protein [Erythrobacter sp.]|jgi:cell pole-organizing protein PopZ|nr:DUF2497 domain-containing protein [Erythrobacter sp.]
MARNQEPSVDEILESIKKVIERDNSDAAQAARRRRQLVTNEPDDERAEQVLDLGEMDLADEQPPQDDEHEAQDNDADAPLIAEEVRGAMQENLAALAMLAQPGAKPQIVRSGETSLEGLTRELLRPMLAKWLDENLPGMVEKLVQAEIARIAGKRG